MKEAGLEDRVEIRLQDYRDVTDGPFDAISSVGMFEHVGRKRLGEYFESLHGLLRPGGRLLNHGISRPPDATATRGPCTVPQAPWRKRTFIDRYVFPDGELHEVGQVVSAMQQRRLRGPPPREPARALQPHLAGLGRQPRGQLGRRPSRCGRARRRGSGGCTWRPRPWASSEDRIQVHQVLAAKPDGGRSGFPLRPAY